MAQLLLVHKQIVAREDSQSVLVYRICPARLAGESCRSAPAGTGVNPRGIDGLWMFGSSLLLSDPRKVLGFLYLREVQFDRCCTAEDADSYLDLLLLAFTSSTMPAKLANGPLMTRTFSPSSNETRGLGLFAPSDICELICAMSFSFTGVGVVPPRKPVIGLCF